MSTQAVSTTPAGGLDITDRRGLVGICYSVWFNAILGKGEGCVSRWHNVSEVEAGREPWGPTNAFHYWSRPALGYYRSNDRTVIRTHMTQLAAAGVDFIIIDNTFYGDSSANTSFFTHYTTIPMEAVCDVVAEMLAAGETCPHIVFWIGSGRGPLFKRIMDDYFDAPPWKDCFVYLDGKPFILTWGEVENCPYLDRLSVRTMRGLGSVEEGRGQWSYLAPDNAAAAIPDADGGYEHVGVSVAMQATYMSNTETAHGRDGGRFWHSQWQTAFALRPKIVTLTWWNEWVAQRLEVAPGVHHFTDNYNREFSRDIEPMEGGHKDQYYQWLIRYISAYKSGGACPLLVEACSAETN